MGIWPRPEANNNSIGGVVVICLWFFIPAWSTWIMEGIFCLNLHRRFWRKSVKKPELLSLSLRAFSCAHFHYFYGILIATLPQSRLPPWLGVWIHWVYLRKLASFTHCISFNCCRVIRYSFQIKKRIASSKSQSYGALSATLAVIFPCWELRALKPQIALPLFWAAQWFSSFSCYPRPQQLVNDLRECTCGCYLVIN